MIQELKVKNCLSFKNEAVFSFEATKDTKLEERLVVEVSPGVRLLRFAMIMGANGSGKSNLLACFNFLRMFWNTRTDDLEESTAACPFKLDSVTKDEPCEVEIKFWINGMKYWYVLKVDEYTTHDERLYFYKSVQPTLVFKRELVNNFSVVTFNPALKVNTAVVEELQVKCLNNMSVLAARARVNASIPYLDDVREWAKESIMPVIAPETALFSYAKRLIHEDKYVHDHILDYLHSANFNIVDLISNEVIEKDFKHTIRILIDNIEMSKEEREKLDLESQKSIRMNFIHKVENERGTELYPLSASLQSYGTQRSMGIETAIYMTMQSDALLPIDEFDTSMHPQLMEYTIRRFLQSDSKGQLLITTHYAPLLSKIDELIRKDCVWFTEKEKNGATNLYPLVEFKGLNRLSSIQNSYLQGKFGAIPNIKPTEE